jgi:hypothetical protein
MRGGSFVEPKIGKAGDINTGIITLSYTSGSYCVIDTTIIGLAAQQSLREHPPIKISLEQYVKRKLGDITAK